ncbi:g6549 [Coccomyxa viridis]|uniref:G6549 protein n=1 Tax=Coccomyxa viridis TaxID=1274662 RepID=A0ABP1FWW6_9CHLO
MSVQVSQEELADLSLACAKLWELDSDRLEPGRDYQLDLQVGKKSYQQEDVAARPLFASVNDQALHSRRTYAAFCSLLDNYERNTGVAEKVSPQKQAEEHNFLDAVMATKPMQYVHSYLAQKNLVAGQPEMFKQQLHQMWFSFYSRSNVRDDTSGFEHVFVGEIDEGKVCGFHNWIQFHFEERAGRVNYLGYLLPRGRHDGEHAEVDQTDRMISLQFDWGRERKEVSSIFIGTSPEFELALYTLCFVAGAEENIVTIAGYELKMRTYHIHSKYGDKVGSSFPELLSKQPGYHRPQAAAPPALPWAQQGQMQPQHAGWNEQPAQQYQQPQYQPQQAQQAWQPPTQGTWQPAGYQPQGYAQPQPPQGSQNGQQNTSGHAQQGCASMMPMIVKGVKYLMRNKQLMNFIKNKISQMRT